MTRARSALSLPLAAAWLLAACYGDDPPPGGGAAAACRAPSGALLELAEDRSVYDDDDLEVLVVDLTVDDLEALADVESDVAGAEVPAVLQEGSFGAGATAPNAALSLRGRTSRLALQKSFKVQLTNDGETWRGQRELNLNKHPYDLTRVRQKLSFELFRAVPHFTSLRTQFVHLFINGEDRGLYTHVEEPDQRFLESHGLDPDGTLYKAQFFGFDPIDPAVAADPEAMESILEGRGREDPEKLLAMLAAVNDPERDINEIVAAHFHRDNYLTWLALNLLLGNWDTRSQNFILYSPSGCATWYFMPWDYDGSLGWDEQPGNPERPRWKSGLANYWRIPLHERFLHDPANVAEVRATMERLRGSALSDQDVANLLDGYHDVVQPLVSASPDRWQLPIEPETSDLEEIAEQWENEYQRLYGVVDELDAEYLDVIERPMPVVLFSLLSPHGMFFQWTPSYELQGRDVTYDFLLSSSPEFTEESMLARREGISEPMTEAPPAPAGTYYWRVIARSEKDPRVNWQISFNAAQEIVLP